VDGTYTLASYDPAGNKATETDALGRVTRYVYDSRSRLVATLLPDGTGPLTRPVTVLSYDLDGNLRAVTDPRGFTTTYDYDSLGRKVTETSPDPDGSGPLGPLVKRFVYDAAGNLRFEIAPGGTSQADVSFTTEHIYDALNRRIRTILPDPDGPTGPLARPVTSQSFDSSGRLSTTTDALGRVTTTLYRSNDRVMRVTAPDGSFMNRIYDAVGNLVFTLDVIVESHGRRTFTSYDAMNRPVSIRSPRADASSSAPITTFRYDVTGNQVSTTDPLGRTTWQQFDALGRLIGRTDALGTAAGDPLHTTRTEYDSAGRVTATIDELGRRTDTVYDSLGRRIRTLAPDDALGRQVSETAPAPAAGSARPVTHYGYDTVGNRTSVTDPLGSVTTFAYDARDRRTTVTDARGFATVTTFDRAGNQTRQTDRLSRVSTLVRATQSGVRARIDRPPSAATGEITPWGVSALGRLLNRHAEPRMPKRRIARMRQTP
jgi:YD repeat-containing protein